MKHGDNKELRAAQELMYQAWEATGKTRVRLAREALALSADCADAYLLLAMEAAESPAESRDYLEKGVMAGERAIGSEMFSEQAGHFWGILETRPYMRVRAGLARLLWQQGDRPAAIAHYQDLLRLNPGDNQGVRYLLVNSLLAEKRYQEADVLMRAYSDDAAADWAYSAALLAFAREGDSQAANAALKRAIQTNPFVPDYLLGIRKLPPTLPDYVGLGDEDEAISYAAEAIPTWTETDGALAWLTAAEKAALDADLEWQASFERLFSFESTADVEEDWEMDGHYVSPFRLKRFLAQLEIPEAERPHFRHCLAVGLGRYYFDIYSYYKFGERPEFLIDERMHEPYIFGYGAKEILQHKQISQASKIKVCHYLLETLDTEAEYGVPYGLLTAIGYLAKTGQLSRPSFLKATMALEFGVTFGWHRPNWVEGATTPALVLLADWLVAASGMTLDEQAWWAWKIGIQCDPAPHLGIAFANRWLARPEVPAESKTAVCWAWLSNEREFTSPPLIWRVFMARALGERDKVERQLRQAGIEPAWPALFELEFDAVVAAALQPMFSWPKHTRFFLLIPNFLKRLAIPSLVRYGESLTDLIALFKETDDTFSREAIENGIADAIQEFHQQLSPETLRQLIEAGTAHGLAKVRKTYYNLSIQFYGDELLRRALQDDAKSVQNWARKKLKSIS